MNYLKSTIRGFVLVGTQFFIQASGPSALAAQCTNCIGSCPDHTVCFNGNVIAFDSVANYCAYPGNGCRDGAYYVEPGCCCAEGTPILIDVDGSGLHLTTSKDGVRFAILGPHLVRQVAWTVRGSTNGWLALDRNENRFIDDATELFGNYTSQSTPPPHQERNGFLALAEFDKPTKGGNGDGVIDERDSVFGSLLIWQDVNHNGYSESMEIHRLGELGVKAIKLDYKESRRVDEFGNEFRLRAKITTNQGERLGHWAWDVTLTLQDQ